MTTETKKEVIVSEFTKQVESGMKRAELASYYSLPETNIAAILKQLGLTIKKTQTPKYTLVFDTLVDESQPVQETV